MSQLRKTDIQNRCECSNSDRDWDWQLVWRGSWVVPNFVPILTPSSSAHSSAASSTTKQAMSSTTSSFNKRTLSLNKKATLDPRQQFVFQSVDGHKLKPVVTEFSQIALAAPKEWPKKHQSYQHSSPADCHNSFSPKFTAPSKHTNIFDSTAPIMKEDTEMHLISKIQLTTFPLYLLASGCLCPCRVFVGPNAKASTCFLEDLVSDDDISYMKARYRLGESKPIGRIGLLMSVVSKVASNTRKRTPLSGLSKHDDNPFLNGAERTNSGHSSANDPEDIERVVQSRLFRETSMFLVYACLDNGSDLDYSDGPKNPYDNARHGENIPRLAFFAYALSDPSQLLGMTLRNPGVMMPQQQTGSASLFNSITDTNAYIEDEDPMVENILNGARGRKDCRRTPPLGSFWNTDLEDDESLWMEMSLLESLDRSRLWSPYVVLEKSSTESLPGTSDRALSRSQTMNALPALSKDDPRTVSSKLSRHQSEGNYAQKTAGSSLTVESKTASIRKGIGRLKSPSRAPQQPLDLSTENLRRKLLGPGSIRKPVVDRVEPVYSIPPGLKSPSRRKFAAGNSRALNLSLGEIPDLTTMMIMKKKQNASLTIGPSPFEVDSDHRSLSPTSQMLTVMQSRANPTMQDNVEGITPPTRSNSLYASLKRIQDDQDVVHRRSSEKAHEIETLSRSHRFASLSKSRSVAGSSHSASLPTDLPSSSTKSVEARNKSTIQGLTRSILSKINIGTDHDDYKQCASNLYRSVKFAMRKDIATKVYHLEELERLMDRHAALL